MNKDVETLGCHHCHQDYACNTLDVMDNCDRAGWLRMGFTYIPQMGLHSESDKDPGASCLPILPDKEPFAKCRSMIPILETADISTSFPNCTLSPLQ